MTGGKILIVEDDATMRRCLKDNFEIQGYVACTAADGEAGYEAALVERPDLIVLDIMLPKINGYELCRLLRKEGLETPILMLTAKGQESDIVLGLNIGADDYITKPFGIKELLARVNAFLRRSRRREGESFRFGDYRLDLESRRLLRGEEHGAKAPRVLALTPREFALLELLVREAGRALTREKILRAVWGWNVIVTGRSVDRCVTTLRNKIEPDPRRPTFIHTVREIGYRFEIPESEPE